MPIIDELHERHGAFPAIDQDARDRAAAAAARIDKHEAVCAERYKAISESNLALVGALEKLNTGIADRFKSGSNRMRRIEWMILFLGAVIILAAVIGDNKVIDTAAISITNKIMGAR